MAGQPTIPFTAIEDSVIYQHLSTIGVYAFAVYAVIKSHRNQQSGDCFPSYATIARISGIHRSTVIACVKLLRGLKLVNPRWRFTEDGSHTSNQYDFAEAESPAPAKKAAKVVKTEQGSRPERPPVVAQDDPSGRPQRPEPDVVNKTKERTSPRLASPTERQKTCPLHLPSEVAYLSDEIIYCRHCYGLLDENLRLITPDTTAGEIKVPQHPAFLEREASAEPEEKQPPVGNRMATTASERPRTMASQGRQIVTDEGKTGRVTNPLVLLGKWLTGALKAS